MFQQSHFWVFIRRIEKLLNKILFKVLNKILNILDNMFELEKQNKLI